MIDMVLYLLSELFYLLFTWLALYLMLLIGGLVGILLWRPDIVGGLIAVGYAAGLTYFWHQVIGWSDSD